MLFSCLFIRQKQKRGIRILASRRRSVRLGSDSLAAARSHSGSDSRLRLSFIALVPLRYAAGASFTTEPVRIRLSKGKGGFEFSRLDDARSGSALTVSLRLGHTRVLTAIQGCHSLPSCRCATSKAVIHYRASSNPLVKRKRGIRILASRRRSVRLGSDSHPRLSFTTEPVRIPCAKRKRGDSNSRVSTPLGQARL